MPAEESLENSRTQRPDNLPAWFDEEVGRGTADKDGELPQRAGVLTDDQAGELPRIVPEKSGFNDSAGHASVPERALAVNLANSLDVESGMRVE